MQPAIKENRWSKELEKALQEKWKGENPYQFNLNAKRIFSIDTPPPYPSGAIWHIGAAAHYSQIDMIARTARALGFSVLFPIGIDRNGLPVELYTEKKYNVHLQDMSREKFISLCRTALDDLEAEMLGIMKSMGMSCDFANYYRTDSESYRALTQSTFVELWKRGIIYEDTRPNNFCFDCGTTIADAEIVYLDLPAQLVHLKFRVKETGKELVIATTRPELLCACQTVMVNPKDDRYKSIVGKHAEIPLYKRDVKIISHPSARPEFGTGALMVCSYGDYTDVRHFRELGLPEIIAVDVNGKMTHASGQYSGMKIVEARKKIIADLERAGLVVKKEQTNHRTPTCERSKTPIEIIPMKEWYLKQLDMLPKLKQLAEKMEWHPKEHKQILLNWIESVTIDWPLSRRRFYGTEIPIWYCEDCGKPNLPKPGPYYQPWNEEPPFKKCSECGSEKGFKGEDRTFDTWFDSSISPLYISKWSRDSSFFAKSYPNTVRPQAKDIIRTWLYYTMLRCHQLTGKNPFQHAWIMGYGVDEKGEKMSKSKGNVVDPIPIIEKYGADAFRFWAASESSLGADFRCSEARIEGATKFLTKLWNVARFISSFENPKTKPKLQELDKWILSDLNGLVKKCLDGYNDFNFFVPSNAIRDWVWNVFASNYLELAKSRAYGTGCTKAEQEAAQYTLYHCLKSIIVLLVPIAPFISDHMHREIFGKPIVSELFPKPGKDEKLPFTTEQLVELDSQIWREKKEKGLSLKTEIRGAVLPDHFKTIEKDLQLTHNIKSLKWGKEFSIKL